MSDLVEQIDDTQESVVNEEVGDTGTGEEKDVETVVEVMESEGVVEYVDPTVKLCKEVTGLDYEEDPSKVLFKMMEDRKRISQEYGIPLLEEYRGKRKELVAKLIEMAEANSVVVSYVSKERLAQEYLSGGITGDGKMVVPKIEVENASDKELYYWCASFEHELLHALQSKRDPNMSIERQEYEAQVLSYLYNVRYLHREDPQGYIHDYLIVSEIFEDVKASCISYYEKNGVKKEDISWMRSGE